MMYGGKRELALHHYKQALALAPATKVVLFEYGLRLPALDRQHGHDRSHDMLNEAAALPVNNAYDKLIQGDITYALETLHGGG